MKTALNLTPLRVRLLAAIHERTCPHRHKLADLFQWRNPKIGPQGITRTVESAVQPLIKAGLVYESKSGGYHFGYTLTDAGLNALRKANADG